MFVQVIQDRACWRAFVTTLLNLGFHSDKELSEYPELLVAPGIFSIIEELAWRLFMSLR
jgi:hypothetical protein